MLAARHAPPEKKGRRKPDQSLFDKLNAETLEARRAARQRAKMRARAPIGATLRGGGTAGDQLRQTGPLPSLSASAGAAGPASGANESPRLGTSGVGASIAAGRASLSKTAHASTATANLGAGNLEPRRDMDAEKLRKCHDEVRALRESYNAVHVVTQRKEKEVAQLEDELRQLELEDDIADQRRKGDEKIALKKMALANLERKLVDTTAYKETLDFMLDRLAEEERTFNSTMLAYEEAIRARADEVRDLQKHNQEIRQSKEKVEAELAQLQDAATKEKIDLEIQLEEKRKAAEQQAEMRAWFEDAEKREEDMRAELDGDMNDEMEKKFLLKNQKVSRRAQQVVHKTQSLQELLVLYEREFQRVKMAVGITEVTSAADIIDKYRSRAEEMRQIDEQITGFHRRIAELRSAQKSLQGNLTRVAQGESSRAEYDSSEISREALDRMQTTGDQRKRELATAKKEFERVRGVLLQLGQSVDGISAKLNHVPLPDGVDEEIKPPAEDANGAEVFVWKIRLIGFKLRKLLESIDPAQAEAADELERRHSRADIGANLASQGDASGTRGGEASTARSPTRTSRSRTASRGGPGRRSSALEREAAAAAAAADEDEEAMATIMEAIVSSNSKNIRVRPGSGGIFRTAEPAAPSRTRAHRDSEKGVGGKVRRGGYKSKKSASAQMSTDDPFAGYGGGATADDILFAAATGSPHGRGSPMASLEVGASGVGGTAVGQLPETSAAASRRRRRNSRARLAESHIEALDRSDLPSHIVETQKKRAQARVLQAEISLGDTGDPTDLSFLSPSRKYEVDDKVLSRRDLKQQSKNMLRHRNGTPSGRRRRKKAAASSSLADTSIVHGSTGIAGQAGASK